MLGVPARRATVAAVCFAALAGACSTGGGGVSGAAKPYVDALTTGYSSTLKTATAAQRTCLAKAAVSAVGVAALKAQGVTPDQLRTSPKALDAVKPTDAQEAAFASGAQRCKAGDVLAPVLARLLFSTEHPGGTHCLAEAMNNDPAAGPLIVYADVHRVPTQDAARAAAHYVDRCFDLAEIVVNNSALVRGLSDAERACVINEERNSGIFVEALVSQISGKPLPIGPENPFKIVLLHCGVSADRIHAVTGL